MKYHLVTICRCAPCFPRPSNWFDLSPSFTFLTVPTVVPVDSAIAVNLLALASDNRPLYYRPHFVTPPHGNITSSELSLSCANGQAQKHPLFPNSLKSP